MNLYFILYETLQHILPGILKKLILTVRFELGSPSFVVSDIISELFRQQLISRTEAFTTD